MRVHAKIRCRIKNKQKKDSIVKQPLFRKKVAYVNFYNTQTLGGKKKNQFEQGIKKKAF